jgi:hypothetical protein
MAKKTASIENRVWLFKDLAAAFLMENGAALLSTDAGTRVRALRALGDVAYAACVVADSAKRDAKAVGELVAKGTSSAARSEKSANSAKKKKKKEKKKARRANIGAPEGTTQRRIPTG